MSKIIRLTSENVKRISVVEIKPDGNLVIVGGRNGQGKSSVLDSIMYALAGGDTLPPKPVRLGEDKAKVEIDMGDMIVKRTFTATGGTTLTVTNKDGQKYSSPQTMLDSLVGRLSFDPLEFAAMNPTAQADTLRALVGLDFKPDDAKSNQIFDERTIVNRDMRSLQSQLQGMPEHLGVDGEEQSTADILQKQRKAIEDRQRHATTRELLRGLEASIGESSKRLAKLREQVSQEEDNAKVLQRRLLETERAVAELPPEVELAPFHQELQQVEIRNRQIRENAAKEKVRQSWQGKQKLSERMTAEIESIEKKKRTALAAAKFPVDGLGLDAKEVTLKGIPFSQASTAEQLRVSVAIGLALNKKLPILLIRRGSDLDGDSLKVLAEMAEQANAQVWLERVGTDGVSVVIEDGHIAEIAN